MSNILTDAQIARLLEERKELPADFEAKLAQKVKPGHRESALAVQGDDGSKFVVTVHPIFVDLALSL